MKRAFMPSDTATGASALPVGRMLLLFTGAILLAAGGWVYVASRPGILVYELFHDPLGIDYCGTLPEFVRYSLPDGLWTLSSILVLHALLSKEPLRLRLAVVSIVPALGILSELLQAAGLLCGVFDPADLACYSLPIIIYITSQLSKR